MKQTITNYNHKLLLTTGWINWNVYRYSSTHIKLTCNKKKDIRVKVSLNFDYSNEMVVNLYL